MKFILPVLLIGLGIYFLRDYVFKSKETKQKWTGYGNRTDAPTFVSAVSDASLRNNDFDSNKDFVTQTRFKTWKNR